MFKLNYCIIMKRKFKQWFIMQWCDFGYL